jgi:hypothetical protein
VKWFFRVFQLSCFRGCFFVVLHSEGEFQSKADVAFFGGKNTEVNGVRQSLEEIILEFSVILVGRVDRAIDGA